MSQQYDVFVSYDHDDKRIAERISRRLRTFKPPRRSGLKRRLSVFRDVERLTAASSLVDLLNERISRSKNLVLLASPASADSEYVDREVASFLAEKENSRLRIVLVRGELHESLPAAILDESTEPLFIDLRDASRKRFRLESLRLIASLYGVDYAELRREDEARQRRRRNSLIGICLAVAFLVTSGYLISTTPADTWSPVRQPVTKTWSNALSPTCEIAVRRSDPNTIVWLGRNARHASYLDNEGTKWFLQVFEGFKKASQFGKRARENLPQSVDRPLLLLSLTAEDGRGQELVQIETRVMRFSDTGGPVFVVKGDLKRANGRHEAVPVTEVDPGPWLETLEPEPARSLRRLGFAGRDLSGRWKDNTSDGALVEVFYTGDMSDEAREVLDAVASAEFLLFSNNETLNAQLQEQQKSDTADDLWSWNFVDNDEWLMPMSSVATSREFTYDQIIGTGPETPAKAEEHIQEAVDAIGPDATFLRSLGDKLPSADFYFVGTRTRPGVVTAVVTPYVEHHEVIKQPRPVPLIKVGDGPWSRLVIPTSREFSVTDVFRLQEVPSTLLCVTDRAGIFRSHDSGKTWSDANFGEGALQRAREIKLIVAPGSVVYVLAVLSEEPGEDINPLFRLERRDWLSRWRLGLARFLSDGG